MEVVSLMNFVMYEEIGYRECFGICGHVGFYNCQADETKAFREGYIS